MNKIVAFTLLFSFKLFANDYKAVQFGRIVDLKGSGFISYEGKTREMKKGEIIEVGAEIVIEHRGQVSFTDNADHRFHLGNESSVRVTSNTVELRSGDLWFQSLNKNDDYKVKTVNAIVNYQGGEGIITYNSGKGKTQLMVINGVMKMANLHSPELALSIAEGHFSFIDNAYDEGAPRDPTPVGEKTYGQLVTLFNNIGPMDKNSATIFKDHDRGEHTASTHHSNASRAVASVDSKKEDKLADIDPQIIESYKEGLLNNTEGKKVVTNKSSAIKVNKKKGTDLKTVVHIYGQKTKPATKSRAPASVLDQEVPKDINTHESQSTSPVSPYSKEYKNQNRESDKLIDDLKKL